MMRQQKIFSKLLLLGICLVWNLEDNCAADDGILEDIEILIILLLIIIL
jgi:hypothetical protein